MMNLTPKNTTIKSLFSTKKGTGYQTRSKRKLESSIASYEPTVVPSLSSPVNLKKGRTLTTNLDQSVVSTPSKLLTQVKITQFLSPSEPCTSTELDRLSLSEKIDIKPKFSNTQPTPVIKNQLNSQTIDLEQPSVQQTTSNPAPSSLLPPGSRIAETPSKLKPNSTLPAHLRFAPASKPGSLPLPDHFEGLERTLKFLLHTMTYTRAIRNTFVYHHLRSAVENASKRSFPVSHLAQFKTLLSDYIQFEPIKVEIDFKQVDSWLIKIPSLGLGSALVDSTAGTSIVPITKTEKIDNLCQVLHGKLVDLVYSAHNEFLSNRSLPASKTLPPKWHPLFNLNFVPSVIETPLYDRPRSVESGTKLSFADQVLAFKNRSGEAPNSSNVTDIKSTPPTTTSKSMGLLDRARELLARSKASTKPTSAVTPSVKGIDVAAYNMMMRRQETQQKMDDLIKSVKAKETILQAERLKNPNPEERIATRLKLSQLKGLVRSIKAIFTTAQGRTTLPLDQVVNQVASKQVWQLSPREVYDLIKFLVHVSPQYVKLDYILRTRSHFVTLVAPHLTLQDIEGHIEEYRVAHQL